MNTVKSIENSSFFKYKAVRVKQTNTGDWLVLFAASASEIEMWVGIPQKKKIGDQETTGFQREENKKRINEIMNFYENEKNIIQNPLLCALRQPQKATVIFEVGVDEQNSNDTIQYGFLTISNEPLEKLSLLELLKRVKIDLERRVPDLANQQLPDQIIRELKQRAEINISQENSEEISDDQPETTEDSDTEGSLEISLTDESHILDFWQEIAAYVSVLEEIKDTFTGDTFLDYSRKSLISFLRPVVVVDGQHRLLAAIAAGKKLAREEPYLTDLEEELLHNETNPEEAQKKIEIKASRKLPVSLLMNTDPAEHVFQFVVVNQKATPIKPALLGTIVSTSLSNQELERVAKRLENAGIKLAESRAVTFLARHPRSPFYGLIERGLSSDTKDRLKWNVLASIVKIFWDLKGGKLFHESVDYADKWRRDYLPQSQIIRLWESEGCRDPFEYWHRLDGIWRDVFIEFWTVVRDHLSETTDDQVWHYWGSPKQSNIFNQTSLTILAADFFQYLCGRGIGIDNVQDIPALVNDWLRGVNTNYFNRDWNLKGVKKDLPGIKKQWAKTWADYRKDPRQLPRIDCYRRPLA